MFTATLNRTFVSYIKAIIGAEYILRWLPMGTHDWNKFLKPEELEKKLTDHKFFTLDVSGLEFNPLFNKWKRLNLEAQVNFCSILAIQISLKRRLSKSSQFLIKVL